MPVLLENDQVRDRQRGLLLGAAIGDAWGAPVEMTDLESMMTTYGPKGPSFPEKAYVTDDTQMMLALADALRDRDDGEQVRRSIAREYLAWLTEVTPDRFPGHTCLESLGRLRDMGGYHSWAKATSMESKGNGANMRVAIAGLLPDEFMLPVAAWQAALTHAHPTAVVSAMATAVLTAVAVESAPERDFAWLDTALEWVDSEPDLSWAEEWLGPVADRASKTVEDYLSEGFYDLQRTLWTAQEGAGDMESDPSARVGGGVTADGALATSLLCLDMLGHSAEWCLRRSVVTGGDSDTIACITGALLGAKKGTAIWDQAWVDSLEPRYLEWINRAALYSLN